MFNKITFLLCCCFFLASCFSKNESEIEIDFSADSTKMIFKGVGEANLYQLQQHLAKDSLNTGLINVVDLAEDHLGSEKIVAGKTMVEGGVVYFIPKRPFEKGHNYWVTTVLNASFATKQDILKSDVGHSVKPQEKVLKR